MSKPQTIILCIFAVLLQWQPWSIVSAQLVPPKGYSVGFTATTTRGVQKYVCRRGSWIKTGSSADLYAPDGSKLGIYWSVYDQKTRAVSYFWNITNTGGDATESGDAVSGLQASAVRSMQASSSAVSEYLAIVKAHHGQAKSELVAFVSLTGTIDGLPPSKALCTCGGATSGVPFTGKFIFYTQDLVPPPLPASLTPKGTFAQVVFLEGKMKYKFSGGKWNYLGFFATMADVAGGAVLGNVGTVSKPDSHGSNLHWHFNDPNGFWLSGQLCAKPVQMSADGCPWQLMKITTSGGTVSPFGPYKFALMAGTLGGQMPKIAARTDGMEWSSCFTAQCYMYAA